MALSCSQIYDYLKYHHRTFVQQQMETETKTHIRALDVEGPVEEWKEWEYEQGGQDHEGFTHWDNVPKLMGAYQLQLDWEWMSMGSN